MRDDAGDIEALERELLAALRDARWDAVAGLLDERARIVTAGWLAEPATREAWLASVRAEHTLDGYEVQSVEVVPLGDAAVALVLSRQRGRRRGEPWSLTFRYTDTWARHGATWKLAARHATVVPQA